MAGSVREVAAYGGAVDWEAGDSSGAPPTDPSAAPRLERAAADARLQAFAAGDPCRDVSTPEADFDRTPRARVQNSVLFQRQAGDADAIDSRDVRQGRLGDCYLLAALGSMASTPQGRDFLRSAIVENKNDAGEVVSYTVTLHESHANPSGTSSDCEVPVTVDRRFVMLHADIRPDGEHREVWPLVVEKACAKYLGGYGKLGAGGTPSDAMELLTGREANYVSLDWPNRWFGNHSEGTFSAALAKGDPVVLNTKARFGSVLRPTLPGNAGSNVHHLVPGHAYFLKGIEERNGKTVLVLGNPWGNLDPDPVPFDALTELFTSIYYGSLR